MYISKFKLTWIFSILQVAFPLLMINGYISAIYGFLGFLIFGFLGLIFGRCPNCHELIISNKSGFVGIHNLFSTTCVYCGQNTNMMTIESEEIRNNRLK